MDVIYIDELPTFTTEPRLAPIGGQAAFVSFADRPPAPVNGVVDTDAQVNILALEPDKPLSTNNVSLTVRVPPGDPKAPPSPFTSFFFDVLGGNEVLVQVRSGATFTATGCTPTFA